MRVKLIQGKIVSSADCIQCLDFSVLAGHSDWFVAVDFGYGDKVIAKVVWSGGMTYKICTEYRGSIENCNYVRYHSRIVPSVLSRLIGLFQLEQISDIRGRQPIVMVAPINS